MFDPDPNTIVGARPALFLDRLRGGLVWLGGSRDAIVAGWIVSYRVANILLWNRELQQSEMLGQPFLLN